MNNHYHLLLETPDANDYLVELSRYVHLNLLRAGMVKRPVQYPWASDQYCTGLG